MLQVDRIYNMDCLEGMKAIPTGSVDMILCDLPYGTTQCEWDKIIPFPELWKEYERVIKDTGAIILTAKQPFTTELIQSNRKLYRYNLVWIKNIGTRYMDANIMPLQQHEDICVFYKKKPTYNPQMESGYERKRSRASSKRQCKAAEVYNKAICTKDYDSTERYPISVMYFPSDKHKEAIHPTQKPVALFEYLIRTYTNKGDTVLDNCIGSGTTAVACIRTGRHYIGFEKKKEYYEAAEQRVSTTQLTIDSI